MTEDASSIVSGHEVDAAMRRDDALDWLPKQAEREANKLYRMMYEIDGENVELVVRTYNAGKYVLYHRACFKCGKMSLEPMATPGHVFCKRNECGGKKQESANRARNADNKAKRDANEPALLELMKEKDVERAPKIKDAKEDQIYAGLNKHNDQKPYLCMRNGKGYEEVCPCGRLKNACVKCKLMVGRKSICKDCGEKTVAYQKGKMLCAGCTAKRLANGDYVPGKTITTEQRFFDALMPLITYPDGSPWSPDQRDQRKDGGLGTPKNKKRGRECPTDTVAYPDCLYIRRNTEGRIILAVFIECDEDSHSDTNYQPSCEAKKVDNSFASLQQLGAHLFVHRDAKGHAHNDMFPIVFLKVNPDACHVKPSVKFEDRVRVAAEAAKHFLWMPENELAALETMVPIVACLYYHETRGKRFLDHYEKLGKADWIFCGNACHQPSEWLGESDA